MGADFCLEVMEEGIKQHGTPEIFTSDQGAQFTGKAFAGLLEGHGIWIKDNIFIERLWWTLKYHYLYLGSFETGSELREGLRGWLAFYNPERFHQAVEGRTTG